MTNYDYLMQAAGLSKQAGVVKRASAYDALMAATGVAQQEKSAGWLAPAIVGAGALYGGQKLWKWFTDPSEKEKKWEAYQRGLETDQAYRAKGWVSKEDRAREALEQERDSYKQQVARHVPLDQIYDPKLREAALAAQAQQHGDRQTMHTYNLADVNRQAEMNAAMYRANQAAVGGGAQPQPQQAYGVPVRRAGGYGSSFYS